jgi:four helix bundle protein
MQGGSNEEFKKRLIIRAFQLAREVIKLVDRFPNKKSAWVVSDQLLRSATSIGANIVEAQAASSKKDFVNFLNHALKSGNETKFWLALTKDLDNQLINQIDKILKETNELVKILGSSIATLKGKKKL